MSPVFEITAPFHEDCTVAIGKRLSAEIKPKWLRIGGYWYPRGGIPIDVFWQTGKLPKGMWIPDQGGRALPRPRVIAGATAKRTAVNTVLKSPADVRRQRARKPAARTIAPDNRPIRWAPSPGPYQPSACPR